MQDPNRPREMPEKKTSQRKEDTNGCTTLLTNNLQKEATSKLDDKLGVWRLDPKRFSSWIRLLRVHARVRRVLLNMRRRDNRNARMELLPEEIKDAEEEIVRFAQREAFCEEYTALRSGKPISKKSQWIKLNPCIDEDGIIRCDGRLKFADFLPYDTRFPIILPRGHWVTKLIVKNYHERGNHAAGVNFTPHFGGAHEVLVKAAKKAIYAVVGHRDVTDEELITVSTGVESLLNSRPLTYQSSDPRDDVPLTPNHFLHGQMGGQFAPESVDTITFHPRQRWRKVQDIISRVWRRWLKECVPALNSRPKWTSEVQDVKVGDHSSCDSARRSKRTLATRANC